eukprot:CAMPEP_0196576930 /NCGR_PEP_ID=MMETSP1081-20130531/6088_1 /TAXON_ID=36882 /ORGANISM="Pyramimonas amylifera, Strain CCMP720" /LENGTH=78 /DNA_ID=CAMNT_0041895675 /DNA_START=841 /DNA_END=1077 /DNA_ORIENTATION=+
MSRRSETCFMFSFSSGGGTSSKGLGEGRPREDKEGALIGLGEPLWGPCEMDVVITRGCFVGEKVRRPGDFVPSLPRDV